MEAGHLQAIADGLAEDLGLDLAGTRAQRALREPRAGVGMAAEADDEADAVDDRRLQAEDGLYLFKYGSTVVMIAIFGRTWRDSGPISPAWFIPSSNTA